jgi:hypothetical protein
MTVVSLDGDQRHFGRQILAGSSGWVAPLLGALVVGLLLASLDLLGAAYWADHPMLAQSIGGLFLFIQGGLLLPKLLSYRDGVRQRKVSQVAYASLAQSANDAGRKLLALLNGADLFALGIESEDREPGSQVPMAQSVRDRLRAHGFEPDFADARGVWDSQRSVNEERLLALLADPEFVRLLFRRVSRVRRELQAAAAVWAPTMFSDPERTTDLDSFRSLVWDCQQLQRTLRDSGILLVDAAGWRPAPGFSEAVSSAFWTFINGYGTLRDHFDKLGVNERIGERRS